jgi:hypothetical protein
MNQKCLTTIFVPVQPLNFNVNPPSICQKHQKPLSYYNKCKPDNDPICIDCLTDETKTGADSNLYIPFSNLEQEYYYQKNAFFQIIEQANNMKKYDSHITNFQQLLTNFFSQFIAKFLKETILANLASSPQKKVDFHEKNNNNLNSKEIMNILNKVENEKYILENKCADVFCQINKLQTILLKDHEKLAKSFKNLLNQFFQDQIQYLSDKKESKDRNSINEQSNKDSSSNPINSPKNTPDNLVKTQFETKARSDDNISQFSPGDDLLINFDDKIKEMSNFASNINLNIEKEKIFEENVEFDIEDDKKINNSHDLNNSFNEINIDKKDNEKDSEKINLDKELEWRKKKNDTEELAWRRKKTDDDNIYLDHKEKINKLIEQDKNKKATVNQSFFKNTKNTGFKKKSYLNKSFQKYHQHKFNFPKKIEYKQYNQFVQKTCPKCSCSFITTKNEEICQNCKYASDEDEHINNRRLRNFSSKKGKFSFFPKNFMNQKKLHISSRIGNKKTFGKKGEAPFNRHFCNKALIHSNSNFLNHHNNRKNSPNLFDDHKRFFNSKFKANRGKDNYDGKFGQKKYKVGRNADDFEVDLESGEESNDDNKLKNGEKSFFKTTDEIFRNDKDCDKDFDDNKSNCPINKKEMCENDEINADDNGDEENVRDEEGDNDAGDNDFEADF